VAQFAGVGVGLGIACGVGRLSGRPPRDLPALGSRYDEPRVEACLAVRMQRHCFTGALAVTGDRLLFCTYGTPFLSVPLAALPGKVAEKTSWFGPPFLEVVLDGAPELPKLRWAHGLFGYGRGKGGYRLRIYTRDGLRLRTALGA